MQQRISQHDALLTGDGPSVLSTAAPVARPEDWEVQLPQGSASSQPVSREECAAMITEALQQKVGPALQAAFSQVGAELVNHSTKINTLEHEVRMLKIRAAWTEQDLMYSQIEEAKRTLVVRNFPEWATAADRELTVAEALKENGLAYLEWDLTTATMEGNDGKKFLAPISILTVPTYDEEKPKEASEGEAEQTAATPGSASTDPPTATAIAADDEKMGEDSQTSQKAPPKKWEMRTWNWNLPIKTVPGITQFERRLGAPTHGLTNAYQKLLARFKKETLTPRWKTLILEDKVGAWLGRILYSRKAHSLTGTTGTVADWACEVQLPAEHKDRILTAWRDVWYDQLKQQICSFVTTRKEELPELWYSPYGKYLWLKVFMVVVLMGMSWFMVFEVNETYGYPLATNRMLNYKNKVLSLDNKNPKKKHVINEITTADVIYVTSYLKKTNVYSEFYKNKSALNNDILEKINAVEMEAFTVASVINPLMAIGKLFREGYSSNNYKMVRTVVQLNKHIQVAVNKEEPGWHNTDSMVIVKYATQSNYENPSLMYSPTHFPYRSTLVKEERGWRAVEVSRKYSEMADPFEEFAEGEKEVVTAISAKPIPLWILGTPYAAGDRADQESHGRDYWKMDLEKGVSNCPVLLGDLENSRYTQGVVEDLKAEAAAEELKKKKEEHYKEKEDSAAPPATEESKDEEPSSPSKSRKQVNRAEETDGYLNMPHDDEVYEADDEFLYESEEEEETESEPTEVSTKVPVEFFDEEKGPPNVDPAFLQKLDDEATVKEIKRLTKMGVISLVSTDPQEATENVPLVDSEQELHKWLTTKLVKDWRFREATGFEVDEATAGTTKPKQIQRCWQRRITKLVPMLALANNWAIYSVDVKDAFLQVNAMHPVFGQTVVMDFWWKRSLSVVQQLQHFTVFYDKEVIEPILKNLKKKVNLQVEGPLLNEEDYEKGFSEETVKFLKRKYTYEHHELRVHSDSKYVKKLVEILKLEKKRAKNSPCTTASQEPAVSQELDEEHSRTYRSCVGILLYLAHDRPDIQFAVRSLSTAMTKPTERKRKELEHLALYLKGTSDYAVTYHKNSTGTSALRHRAEEPQVNYDVDSLSEAKKEASERAEKLKKVEESLDKEKEEFEDQKKKFEEEKKESSEEKTKFEETVKRFLAKQKEVKEKEDKVTEREEKVEKDLETLQGQAKALSEKETALEEAEEKVKEREAEVEKKNKEAEKRERKAQERTAGYDQEREEYAKKYVDDAKKDLERELKVLKQEEKVRNQKLDDLQYDYKSLKDDYQYFKGYSKEVDALLLAAKDKIVKYKKKVKSLKETIGAALSGSEGEEETEEAYKTKAEEEKEKKEAQAKEDEKKKGKRPKQVETEDQEEKPSSNQGDDATVDPDIAEFTQLGYVWEFNKKTQEYRVKCEDKKGSPRIKNAPVKGRLLWNKVTECYRKHNVWFVDGKELDKYLEGKENEKIEEEVQRRISMKGKNDNTGTKGKGPPWDDGQNDSWWYGEQWNNENWNTTDDGSGWYENANPHNKGYWQTPEEWAQQNQWDQWTPKGKSKGKKSKNWAQTQ
ncbi:unnamed protein product [Symbiodinium sp. CCMP2592]|nr:unnamed protein product [Symbiodinium sp. CCMP2592]